MLYFLFSVLVLVLCSFIVVQVRSSVCCMDTGQNAEERKGETGNTILNTGSFCGGYRMSH